MTLPVIHNPFDTYIDLDGLTLNAGDVYIGIAGMDPQTNPQAVFWDAAATIPATQPLDTLGGYIVRAGTPARAYTAPTYSMRVRDRSGVQVFYEPNANSSTTSLADLTFLQNATGAVVRTALSKMQEPVSVMDFGAVGTTSRASIAAMPDDTAAIQAALNYAVTRGCDLLFPGGLFYKITAPLVIDYSANSQTLNLQNRTVNLTGGGSGNTQIVHSGFAGAAIDVRGKIVSAGVTAKICFQGFSISAGVPGVGTGLKLDNVAYGSFIDFAVFSMAQSLDATDFLTSSFHGCLFLYGVSGVKFAFGDLSRPNAISFHGCSIGGFNENALDVTGGTAISFFGGSIEANGVGSVDPNRAAVRITNPDVEGGTAFNAYGLHIEGNSGLADFLFNMSTTDSALINFEACNIQRGGASKTTNNILVQQNTSTTGPVVLNAPSAFRHFSGYTPAGGEPAIRFISDPACEYTVNVNGALWGSEVYQWNEINIVAHAAVLIDGATGNVLSQHSVKSVVRNSAGLYTITFRNKLRSGLKAGVHFSPAAAVSIAGRSANLTLTTVQVACTNLAGTATDPTTLFVSVYDGG